MKSNPSTLMRRCIGFIRYAMPITIRFIRYVMPINMRFIRYVMPMTMRYRRCVMPVNMRFIRCVTHTHVFVKQVGVSVQGCVVPHHCPIALPAFLRQIWKQLCIYGRRGHCEATVHVWQEGSFVQHTDHKTHAHLQDATYVHLQKKCMCQRTKPSLLSCSGVKPVFHCLFSIACTSS